MEQFQALNFIGKAVAGDSSKINRAKGDKEHDFRFNVPQNSTEINIKLKNADGEVVKNYKLKNLKAGENKITWNGEDDKGTKMMAGEYQFSVEAVGASGQKMNVKTEFEGVITGVNYSPEGPVLLVGNQSVRLRDVKKITDPSLMKNDQKIQNVTTPDLKSNDAIKQTDSNSSEGVAVKKVSAEDTGAPEADRKTIGNFMNSIGLSQGMMNKLAKETKE
jgi:flagellar basal-body rod modification protein FlgD